MRPPQTELVVAPLLLRLSAIFIDVAILVVIGFIVMFASDPDALENEQVSQGTFAIGIITGAIYNIGFLATMSATPGKMAMGLYVGDKQGARLRPDTAILRYIVFLIGNSLLIGFAASLILLFVDRQRRTVHDRIAGTLVLRRQADTPPPPPDLQ